MSTYKTVNKEYRKMSAKLAEETPWNKLGVDIIDPIHEKKRETVYNLKSVIIIDPVTGGLK